MEYISTRNKNLSFNFKEIFLRGLAPDGGLFIPKKIKRYNGEEIKKLSDLGYIDLATEILFNFCSSTFEKNKLRNLIEKSYKNFNNDKTNSFRIITKKPITPSSDEIKINPRSKSAKLRVAEKI